MLDLHALRATLALDPREAMLMVERAILEEGSTADFDIRCPKCGTKLISLKGPCSVCLMKAKMEAA
jgi:DNA-directed RNA polymerase subunit RPC12/RpoP